MLNNLKLWPGLITIWVCMCVSVGLAVQIACNNSDAAAPDPVATAVAEAMKSAVKAPVPPQARVDWFIERTIKKLDANARCREWDSPDTRLCEVGGGLQQLWCAAKSGEKPHCEISFDLSPYVQKQQQPAQPPNTPALAKAPAKK